MQLREDEYVECQSSLMFPKIPAQLVRALIEQGKQANNQNAAIRELRNCLRDRANGGG